MTSKRSMLARISGAAVTTVVAAGLAVSVPALSASAAPRLGSINAVKCGSAFLQVHWHLEGGSPGEFRTCLANAGTAAFGGARESWLDSFSTGNNRVQFLSDGGWQPATPVAKNTTFIFPNHPGGVRFTAMRIR